MFTYITVRAKERRAEGAGVSEAWVVTDTRISKHEGEEFSGFVVQHQVVHPELRAAALSNLGHFAQG